MLFYAATIFLSAFLLFQVQPLIAKFILPWFGGSAAVWSAALLFFQLLLLAGYLYAHLLIRYLTPKRQFWLHAGLLAAGLATLPIIPSAGWKPMGGGDPTLRILLLLSATVGLPYMLLAATSPLLQAWYLRTHPGAIPYRLFALSNLGSMLALLSYPALVEPRFALGTQAVIWSSAFAVFAALCAIAGWRSRHETQVAGATGEIEEDSPPPGIFEQFLWVGLAACASTLLLAVTSHLTQNVAPIPLLWIAPLSLYLLSFILCFESDRLYNRIAFLPLLVVSLGLFTYGNYYLYENNADIIKELIPALCGALFVCCMVCHGELARRKPHPRYLTQFYLMVSLGGAVGGIFVALAAPHWFHSYTEFPIGLAACAALVTCVLWNQSQWWLRGPLLAATLGFAVYLGISEYKKDKGYLLSARNFYGLLRVRDDPPGEYYLARRTLIYGTINHGTQLLQPGSERMPTSYFGPDSGVSRAIRAKGESGPIHIGVLGLGAGVTATLARKGDTIHYYEINPLIVQIASHEFGFLRGCPADKQILMGDGRLVLERLPSEQLDVFVIDAFTSDAIPIHLLTREAFSSYQRHLKPEGLLVIHITNRYLDLQPVVAQAATEMGWLGVVVSNDAEEEEYFNPSTWVVLARSPKIIFEHRVFNYPIVDRLTARRGFRAWTDDYSNLIQILRTN